MSEPSRPTNEVSDVAVPAHPQMERAAAALRRAENRYNELFNSIDQGFCTIEVAFNKEEKPVDYRFLEVSPSFERQTGIKNGAGRWMREIAPDQDEFWFETYGRVAWTGEAARFEHFSTPLGRWWAVYAFRIDEPELRRIAVLFNDITERKQAEEAKERHREELAAALLETARSEAALRQSREMLRVMSDSVPVLISYVDAEGRYRMVNRAYTEWFGLTQEELLGRTVEELVGEATWREIGLRLNVALAGEAISFETEAPYRLGGTRWVDIIYTPDCDPGGEVRGVVVMVHDITAAKRAEAIIRASRDEFQQMADTAPAMLWITEPDGFCTFLSRSWYEFTGQTPEEGHGLGWTNAVHPDERAAAGRAFLAASKRREFYAIDFRLRRADGEYRWVIDAGRPRFGENGEFLGFIGSVVDIHERKLAEAALAERAIALRDADRRKDEFLAMLAHELRNPLASVTNAAALLQEGAEADEQRWAADVITRQSGQLARLVDDLLDVSRITRGKIALRKVPLDVAQALDGACEAIAPLIAERTHSLAKEFPRGKLWVEADPARLEQIIGNLLANAARYTEPRGEIHISARREQDSIVISVRDSGIGIEPARIQEMFELFAQGERGIARSEGGLGIGLTIVRGLCELHGGSVEAHSEGPGTGSVFTVRLPAITPPAAAVPGATLPAAAGEGAGARLLIVDDNIDTATGLARLLARRGYVAEIAHDGPEALQRARALLPAAVLLDIGLPMMDGYEVARRLRAEPVTAGVLIIALSGYGQDEDRARSRAAGFDHHLVKPVDLDALRAVLTSGLKYR